ncbi:MAG: undecaprenyl-diphosphate phosphatase [Candidatus Omnitrophica bacterium]|nr:undecaprenyl-diphosphate phosphatase [Candidatus Omnitrophota bacterium]
MIKYIILAVLQGLTEFLPVSSSGHLALANSIFNFFKEPLFYIVTVHLGTTFALVVFFFRDILNALQSPDSLKKISIVTGISLLFGFLGRDFFKYFLSNRNLLIFAFLVNGLILILANRRIGLGKKDKASFKDCFVLGLAQVVGMLGGISRSGVTISALLFRGVKKEEAFRFSFLAAIPVIFLAFIFEWTIEGGDFLAVDFGYYIVGFVISFIVGYAALFCLNFLIKKSRLDIFGYYCLFLSLLNIVLR